MLNNQIDTTRNNFIKYLETKGLSPKTHKNYKSDLSHFTGWLILRVRSFGSYVETLSESLPFLSKNISTEYKGFLIENKIPVKTINRRLSTLRHLSKFLVSAQALDLDFMENVENISESKKYRPGTSYLINEFRAHLEAEKISKNTIKNYVSDVNQFLTWMESIK